MATTTRKPATPRVAKPKLTETEVETDATAEATRAELYGQIVSRTDHNRPFVTSNRFSIANVEVRGRELAAIAPVNWVGPAPLLIPMTELDELISDLTELRAAPGPYDTDPDDEA